LLYVDSSAVAKLLLPESESEALRTYLDGRGVLGSSVIVGVEVRRAVRRVRPDLREDTERVLAQVVLIQLNDAILTGAAALEPPQIRSLDAIHIASARALGGELEAVVTYDARMAEAARGAGLRVEAPE
jgi:predicted nucleic acid-binding protein